MGKDQSAFVYIRYVIQYLVSLDVYLEYILSLSMSPLGSLFYFTNQYIPEMLSWSCFDISKVYRPKLTLGSYKRPHAMLCLPFLSKIVTDP